MGFRSADVAATAVALRREDEDGDRDAGDKAVVVSSLS
jgi:hypothetical protein